MVDIADLGRALGRQARNDHGGAGPQVAGADPGAGELFHALDHGDLAVHLDLGAHAAKFIHIAVTVVPYAFREHAGSLGQTEDGGNLGLHIGRETGVGQGLHVGAGEIAGAAHQHRVVPLFDRYAHFQQLGRDALQMLGDDVFYQTLAAGGSHGGHVSARLDLIGNDGVAAAAETRYPADLDDVGARAHDVGPHGVEEVGQVHHMRLFGGVLDDRHALGQNGGEHDVHGSAHGDDVQVDLGALHPARPGAGVNIAALYVHVGPHGHKTLDVLVNGAPAEVAAAGRGDLRRAEAAQQRADQIVGGPNLAGQLLRDAGVADMGAVDVHRSAVDRAYVGTQILEDIQDQRHVADLGNVLDAADAVHQQGGGDDSDSGVLGAADVDLSKQRSPAVNYIFRQTFNPLFLPCASVSGTRYPRAGEQPAR